MKALIITVMVLLFLFAVEFIACALVSLVTSKKEEEID